MNEELDLRAHLLGMWRRRLMVIGVALGAALGAALLNTLVFDPTYEASAVLALTGENLPGPALTADTIVPLMHNEVVAAEVAQRLSQGRAFDPATLVRNVSILPLRGGTLFRVSARETSAQGAVEVTAAWAEVMVARANTQMRREIDRTLSVQEAALAAARVEVVAAERALRDFRAKSKSFVLERRIQDTAGRIVLYEGRLLEIEQIGAPAERELVLLPQSRGYTLSVSVPRHPALLRRGLTALKARLAMDQAALATEQQRDAQLTRAAEVSRSTFQMWSQRVVEWRIVLSKNPAVLRVAVTPVAPNAPVAPRTALNVAIAGILGLMFGIGLAFARGFADRAPAPAAVRAFDHAVSPPGREA